MLGRKVLDVDQTLVNPAAFTPLLTGQLELGFFVEEEEMLIDLELNLTYSNTVVEATDFTLFVDGLNAGPTHGFYRHTAAVIADENTVYFNRTVRLAQGEHTVEMRLKAPTGDVTVQALTADSPNATLVARRHSHPATLGHGVDSKVPLIQ